MYQKFQIANDYQQIGPLCTELQSILCSAFTSEEVSQITLGLTEALNNIVEHSYQGVTDQAIEITLRLNQTSVEISIIDYGQGMDVEVFETVSTHIEFDENDIDTLPEGGMGISLIKCCMDESHYQNLESNNKLTLIKRKSLSTIK